jgi:hypothetical protein
MKIAEALATETLQILQMTKNLARARSETGMSFRIPANLDSTKSAVPTRDVTGMTGVIAGIIATDMGTKLLVVVTAGMCWLHICH